MYEFVLGLRKRKICGRLFLEYYFTIACLFIIAPVIIAIVRLPLLLLTATTIH